MCLAAAACGTTALPPNEAAPVVVCGQALTTDAATLPELYLQDPPRREADGVGARIILDLPYPVGCGHGATITIAPPGVVSIAAAALSRDGAVAALTVQGLHAGTTTVSAELNGHPEGATVVTVTAAPAGPSGATPAAATAPSGAGSEMVTAWGGQPVAVSIFPSRGPVGTVVRVTGTGFTGSAGQQARSPAYFFTLERSLPGCQLLSLKTGTAFFGSDGASVTVDGAGNLSGQFRVPPAGTCVQPNHPAQSLNPGTYHVVLGSHPIVIGQFVVTSS